MAERRHRLRRGARAALLCAALAALGGCAADKLERQRKLDMAELLGWLPGTYDNTAQAERDAQQSVRPAHDRLQLAVVSVPAPRLGHHVYYVQEMAADDARRVMSERLWSFKVDDEQGIVQTVYTPREPVRWRDGQNTPDLFTGIVIEDVDTTAGCEIVWKKADEQFIGANDPKKCHVVGAARVDWVAQLTPDTLSLADTATDAAGRTVRGRTDEPYNRFRKTR